MAVEMNLPVPNSHCEPLYRQTYNTYGQITTVGLTQDNRVGTGTAGLQKANNARLNVKTNKGILAGSVVAVAGDGLIGPADATSGTWVSDSTTVSDGVVGVAVNDALGNPYESSSAVASNKVVYMHGTGTVIKTDIYETKQQDGTTDIVYVAGDKLFASRNGLLTNSSGNVNGAAALAGDPHMTVVGILLQKPTAADPCMVVQLRI